MSRALGFVVGLVLVAAAAAAWLAHTDRVAFTVPGMTQAPTGETAPASPEPPPGPSVPQGARSAAGEPDEGATMPVEPPENLPPAPDTEAPAPAPNDAGPPRPPETRPAPAFPTPDGEDTPVLAQAAVWQPFRSERAASGFATHLAERYGVATSVRRDGPGRYRVLVVADDPEDLASELERLRAETGLARLEERP